jgi:tRNA(Arg) A34 adenosine deaminase TadA
MAQIDKYFRIARQVALKGDCKEANRHYRVGAVGIRTDGAVVTASNIVSRTPNPLAHAEARVTKKLDWGSTVYVVRIHSDGTLALARPCRRCQGAMRLRGVKRCYYSISDSEWGIFNLTT